MPTAVEPNIQQIEIRNSAILVHRLQSRQVIPIGSPMKESH